MCRLCFYLRYLLVFAIASRSLSQSWNPEVSPWLPKPGFSPARPVPPWVRQVWNTSRKETWIVSTNLTRLSNISANSTISNFDSQVHQHQTGLEMDAAEERRLLAATVLGPTLSQISGLWASNIAMARLTSTKAIVAYSDYKFFYKGRVVTCEVSGGSLSCGTPLDLTSVPIYTDAQSLAIDSIWMDQVIFAWKQGVSPFIGHVQACKSDVSSCGTDLEVRVEWGCVAVLVLAQRVVVFAYNDLQVGNRGSIVRCDVANMNLNCDLAKVFETKPVSTLALGALTSDTLSYSSDTTDMIIAYQVSSPTEHFGLIQPCELVGSSLACYRASSIRFNDARTEGMSITAFAADAFVLGYADWSLYCPRTNRVSRRRALHVCTTADGHPSIGRLKLCHAQFRGLGISSPILQCSQLSDSDTSDIIDDGYSTGVPHIVKRDGTPSLGQPWHFLAIYPCTGCNDLAARGWARSCIAGPMAFPIPRPGCSNRLAVNSDTTQWPKAVAIDGGFMVAYNDYGGSLYLSARMIT